MTVHGYTPQLTTIGGVGDDRGWRGGAGDDRTEDDRTPESRPRGTEPERRLAMASGGRGGGRGREAGTSRPKGLGWKLVGLELKKWYIPN